MLEWHFKAQAEISSRLSFRQLGLTEASCARRQLSIGTFDAGSEFETAASFEPQSHHSNINRIAPCGSCKLKLPSSVQACNGRAVDFLHLPCSPENPKCHVTWGTESVPAFGVAMTFQRPAAECAGSGGHLLSPVSF